MPFIKKYFKNFYVLATLFFVVWLAFFDKNDFFTQYQLKSQVNELRREKTFYEEKVKIVEQDHKELLNNSDLLEKFAREKYYMHKESEDVYILEVQD